jgi:hypothetical protein
MATIASSTDRGIDCMAWTDERVGILKRMWSAGESSGEIAAVLGSVSRNAVMGKVNRLGLMGDAAHNEKRRDIPRSKPRTASTSIDVQAQGVEQQPVTFSMISEHVAAIAASIMDAPRIAQGDVAGVSEDTGSPPAAPIDVVESGTVSRPEDMVSPQDAPASIAPEAAPIEAVAMVEDAPPIVDDQAVHLDVASRSEADDDRIATVVPATDISSPDALVASEPKPDDVSLSGKEGRRAASVADLLRDFGSAAKVRAAPEAVGDAPVEIVASDDSPTSSEPVIPNLDEPVSKPSSVRKKASRIEKIKATLDRKPDDATEAVVKPKVVVPAPVRKAAPAPFRQVKVSPLFRRKSETEDLASLGSPDSPACPVVGTMAKVRAVMSGANPVDVHVALGLVNEMIAGTYDARRIAHRASLVAFATMLSRGDPRRILVPTMAEPAVLSTMRILAERGIVVGGKTPERWNDEETGDAAFYDDMLSIEAPKDALRLKAA